MSGVDGTGRMPADFPSPPRGPGRICRSPDEGRRGAPATRGRGTAPPAALPPVSEPPEMRSPGATYRACKPENRQRSNSSFVAMVSRNVGRRVRGLGPRAASSGARASPLPVLRALAASDVADRGATRAPGRRGGTGASSGGRQRPRRPAGLLAAPPGSRGTPGPSGAPPRPRSRAGSAQPAGWSRWARAVPGPEDLRPRSSPPCPEPRAAPRAAARAVGYARAVRPPCAPAWGRRGGRYSGSDSEEAPAGWSSPNYTFDNARGEES